MTGPDIRRAIIAWLAGMLVILAIKLDPNFLGVALLAALLSVMPWETKG